MSNLFDNKEKLGVVIAEYKSLRSAAVQRAGTAYQLVGFTVAGVAALAAASLWGLLALFICAAALMAWVIWTDVQSATARIREIESRVNADAGETLLVWETQKGGIVGQAARWLSGRLLHSN